MIRRTFFFLILPVAAFAEVIESDVCVYGGTSGGVVAAVQAARMGKPVVIAEPGKHLGGMTSGGLSAVDIGDPRSVGGIAREYFTRLVAAYGKKLEWDKPFKSSGGPATGGAYAIEPHQAGKVFDDMAREAGVSIHLNAHLDAVKRNGARITELVTESGDVFRAKMFIDCTYEGDLMAKAGVSYTLMREGNAKYGEQLNGIQYDPRFKPRSGHLPPGANGRVKGGQGVWDRDFPLDPFVVIGCPDSGTLPLVEMDDAGRPGDPAPGVQAYCYRLCLSTSKDRLPIAPPPNYDATRYELVVRFIEACKANGDDMDLRWFSKHDPLPNDKWDFNTATFGGNLPGASHAWPEAGYAEREKIAKQHENYHRGLLYFLATDPRVPEKVRKDMQRFGLPRDEFTDTGGWPHQLYIREARRMESDLVMTEHHTFGREIAPKSVGLGSYGTDAHEIRRIVKDGVVTREGKLAGGRDGAPPYAIGYDAIVPKQGECENLFVTFALSASHSAFASIRMEPVFMVTSQSAATAACMAIDDGMPVQKVDYPKLHERLTSDGQVLEWKAAAKQPKAASSQGGILLDDGDAKYTGAWVGSAKQTPLLGSGYRHDNNHNQGSLSAQFAAEIATSGDYEVRLLYVATNNRATNVPVTVTGADSPRELTLNQREPCVIDGVPRALGVFRFEKGGKAIVTITNKDTNGFVVVDGLQIVPADIAKAERAGERKTILPVISSVTKEAKAVANPMARAVAVSPLGVKTAPSLEPKTDDEQVHLAKDAVPADVNGRHFDLIVVGGSAGGVACAVRAAREGCSVLLVQHNRHIGGMLSNGLMQWDALYGGPRAPIFTELLGKIEQHYIETFGRDSKEHQTQRYTHEHYPVGWVEPHVMERECNRLVASEKNITLLLSHYPAAVERDGSMIKSVTLRAYGTTKDIRTTADMFADATYEGDLFALAKVPYRVGREAREEYGEPHAGKVFTSIARGPAPNLDPTKLNIRPYGSHQGGIDPTSPFTADGAVQAFNFRFCVSKDPDNRLLPGKPANYNREEFVKFDRKGIATNAGPNLKSHMNSPILPGENHAYPEASWPEREKIIERHRDFALGLMWFLQNDESVSEKQRAGFREWGLARDEFTDNNHIPYEMYVREARRIAGRHVFTEHDNSLAKDYARTPIMPDSIAITDWYMDSHSCTTDSRPGFHYDGKLILTEESRPAQIPFRALLPQGVDNLLVPVCLSATHVAWGAVRLEPVWMQTGEAAGFAAALAKKDKTTPGNLDADLLVRTLVKNRQMVSFFNDVKVDAAKPWIEAAQYLGTKGFFASYDVQAGSPLDAETAAAWSLGLDYLIVKNLKPEVLAKRIHNLKITDGRPMTSASFAAALKQTKSIGGAAIDAVFARHAFKADVPVSRGDACILMYELV